ncbi:hypothetical protein TMES_17765 [Thalassospira mesophila]|uniref:Uncharacterized protein n=1 Tax=Thalassospira mesophila TaxID=1293891 RepID=A0A1Y2KWP3_9PROT|nr:hypothetical protein TMES_17765 [Thalassospira mesophila]
MLSFPGKSRLREKGFRNRRKMANHSPVMEKPVIGAIGMKTPIFRHLSKKIGPEGARGHRDLVHLLRRLAMPRCCKNAAKGRR